jgi:(heptosyl)LPS beta-1,4-glucosyltransferase
MQGIAAVIITLNEARNIGRCLDSLAGLADEVLVLDSGSTDGTQEIAASKGAKVVEVTWQGYSATKNLGNDMASQAYILSLDADEALSEELKASILALKGKMSGAYSFNRLAFYCNKPIKHGGWYPDEKLRLFPKGQAKWQGAFVHEELILEKGLAATKLKGDLLHYTYYTVAEHKERAAKYARLAADKLQGKAKAKLLAKALFSPGWRFFQMYFLKLGFLDGWRGWRIATVTAGEVWRKYWWAMKIKG